MLNRGTCEKRLWKAFFVLEALVNNPVLAGHLGMARPDSPRLQRGWSLYRAARAANDQRKYKRGEAQRAAAHCVVIFQSARVLQARLTSLARFMITAPSARDRLGLTGRRPEALAAWRMQAALFHANLRDEDRRLLAEVGVDEALLAKASGLIEQLEAANAACVEAQAEARRATEEKTAAFAELAGWMTMVNTMARGLELDYPGLIAELGIPRDRRRNRAERRAAALEAQEEAMSAQEPAGEAEEDQAEAGDGADGMALIGESGENGDDEPLADQIRSKELEGRDLAGGSAGEAWTEGRIADRERTALKPGGDAKTTLEFLQ